MKLRLTLIFVLFNVSVLSESPEAPQWGGDDRPNILFILVDDLGWNDLSFHGGSDFETPHLDELALDAFRLTNYYVQPYCTPTRSALMSGRYPMRDGLQQWVIRSSSGYGMPLDITTLPEELKRAGYSTHLLGKWHLGFFDPAYTPTERGFDSFIGYYGDKEDYFLKNNSEWAVFQGLPEAESLQRITGFDFRKDSEPWVSDEYSTYLYGAETLILLNEHVALQDPDPMFILMSSQAAHSPYDAPQDIKDQFSYISDGDRQELAAVIYCLDQTVGDIVDYLRSEDSGYLWDDTLVIVSSDNGGTVTEGASNFPLRGGKKSLWEGGVRATAFITGGWLPEDRRGEEMNALMHVTDWLPTLCSIAGISPTGNLALDGYDQSGNFINGVLDEYSPREEILLNVVMYQTPESDGTSSACHDDFCGAIRWRDYKLVLGNDNTMTWSDDTDSMCSNSWCENAVLRDDQKMHTVSCSEDEDNYGFPTLSEDSCLFSGEACLFNVADDPCEWIDIGPEDSEMVAQLTLKLKEYNDSQAFPLFRVYPENATLADPALFGGFWSPWENTAVENDEFVDDVLMESEGQTATADASVNTTVLLVFIVAVLLVLAVAGRIYKWWSSAESGYKRIGDAVPANALRA